MFESLVLKYIGEPLKKYFTNINVDNFQVNVSKGNVELTDLQLNPDVLQTALSLPFTIKFGRVGRLAVHVSWSSLLSAPLVAELSDVYILIALTDSVDADSEAVERTVKEAKEKLLKDFAESMAPKDAAKEASTEKYLFRVLNNLQLTVSNIHIRFESTTSSPLARAVAAGVSLRGLSAYSADSVWQRVPIANIPHQARKLLNLEQLAVYFDPQLDAGGAFLKMNSAAVHDAFRQTWHSNLTNSAHNLLAPLSVDGRLTLNKNIAQSNLPKMELALTVGPIQSGLRQQQFHELLYLGDFMTWATLRSAYLSSRPRVPLHGHSVLWWKFAVNAVLFEYRRRTTSWTWDYLKKRRDLRIRYVERFLPSLKGHLSADARKELADLELVLDVNDIIRYRKIAYAKHRALKETKSAASTSKFGWISSLFSSSSSSSTSTLATSSEAQKEAEQAQLRKLLEEDSGFEESTNTTSENLSLQITVPSVKFVLSRAPANQRQQDAVPDLTVVFYGMQFLYKKRNAPHAHMLRFQLLNFSVAGRNSIGALHLLSGTTKDVAETPSSESASLLEAFLEIAPVRIPHQPKVDAVVKLRVDSVLVDVNPYILVQSVLFFAPPPEFDSSNVSTVIAKQLSDLQAQSRIGLNYVISEHKVVDFSLDLKSPVFYLPATDKSGADTPCLKVMLGDLRVVSRLQSETDLSAASISELKELAYDKYDLSLLHPRVWITTVAARLAEPDSRSLLVPCVLQASFDRCIATHIAELTLFRCSVVLPELTWNLSDLNVLALLRYGSEVERSVRAEIAPLTRVSLQAAQSREIILHSLKTASGPELDWSAHRSTNIEGDEFFDAQEAPPPVSQEITPIGTHLSQIVFEGSLSLDRLALRYSVAPDSPVTPSPSAVPAVDSETADSQLTLLISFDRLSLKISSQKRSSVVTALLQQVSVKYMLDRLLPVLAAGCEQGSSSESQESAVSLALTSCDPKSSLFNAASIQNDLRIRMSRIQVTIQSEVVTHAARVSLDLLVAIKQSGMSRPAPSPAGSPALASTTPRSSRSALLSVEPPRKAGGHDGTLVKIAVELEEIEVKVGSLQEELLALQISGFKAEFVQSISGTLSLDARLASLQVSDRLSAQTLHKHVLSVDQADSSQLLHLIVSFTGAYEGRPELSVNLALSRLRLTICYQFIAAIAAFAETLRKALPAAKSRRKASLRARAGPEEGLANTRILSIAEAKIATALEKVKVAGTDTPVVKPASLVLTIKADIAAPLVVIPRSSVSEQLLCLDLGALHFENDARGSQGAEQDIFKLQLAKVGSYLTTMSAMKDPSIVPRQLLAPVSMSMEVRQVKDVNGELLETHVQVVIGQTILMLSRDHYLFLLALLKENLAEGTKSTNPAAAAIVRAPSSASLDLTLASSATFSRSDLSSTPFSPTVKDDLDAASVLSDSSSTLSFASFEAENYSRLTQEPMPTTAALLRVESFDLRLLEPTSVFTASDSDTCFASLNVDDLSALFQANQLGPVAWTAQGSIANIKGIDHRLATTSPFRKFVSHAVDPKRSRPTLLQPCSTVSLQEHRLTLVLMGVPKSVSEKQISAVFPAQSSTLVSRYDFEKCDTWFALVTFGEAQDAVAGFDIASASEFLKVSAVRVVWGPSTSLEIVAGLEGLTVKVSPALFLDMSHFFAPPALHSPGGLVALSGTSADDQSISQARPRSVSVQSMHDQEPLPKASDFVLATMTGEDLRLIFIEDLSHPNSRIMYLKTNIGVKFYQRDEQKSVELQVTKFSIHSYQHQFPKTTLVRVLSPTSVHLILKMSELGELTASVSCAGSTIKVSYRDIKVILAVLAATEKAQREFAISQGSLVGEEITRNQAVQQVPPPRSKANVHRVTGGRQEAMSLALTNITVMLVNNIGFQMNPVMLLSATVEGLLHDWTSVLSGSLNLHVAAAMLHPEQAMWEPFVLGQPFDYRETRAVLPWNLKLNLDSNEDEFVDLVEVAVHAQSPHGHTTEPTTKAIGSSAKALLASKPGAFWDADCRRSPEIFVVFQFCRPTALSGFEYAVFPESKLVPGKSHLMVNDDGGDKWRHVTTMSGIPAFGCVVRSAPFTATGLYWKWALDKPLSRKQLAFHIQNVKFVKDIGGASIQATASNGLEVSLSSAVTRQLVNLASAWTADLYGVSSLANTSAKTKLPTTAPTTTNAPATIKGSDALRAIDRSGATSDDLSSSHELVNQTSVDVAFCTSGTYAPMRAKMLQTGESSGLSFSKDDNTVEQMITVVDQRPITDLAIICFSDSEHPPPGFDAIHKDLNSEAGKVFYLCISRKESQDPITDIQILYMDNRHDALAQIVPDGYVRIDKDINWGVRGGRDVFVCFRRGSGAPITDVSILHITPTVRESVPHGFTIIRQNLNSTKTRDSHQHYLCIKREPAQLVPSYVWPPADRPITEISIFCKRNPDASEVEACTDATGIPWKFFSRPGWKDLNRGVRGSPDVILRWRYNPALAPITSMDVVSRTELKFCSTPRTAVLETNLNTGTSGPELLLLYRREPAAPYIVDIDVIYADTDIVPTNFVAIPRSTNEGTRGKPVHICYKLSDCPAAAYVSTGEHAPSRTPSVASKLRPRASERARDLHHGASLESISSDRSLSMINSIDDLIENTSSSLFEADAMATDVFGNDQDDSEAADSATLGAARLAPSNPWDLRAIQVLTSAHNVGRIGLEVDGWLPLEHIKCTSIGTRTLVLQPTWRAAPARVVLETLVEEDHKVTRIHGPLILVNHFLIPLCVSFPRARDFCAVDVRLDPGQTFVVPIGVLDQLQADPHVVTLYRFWNARLKSHFYSTRTTDIGQLPSGFTEECALGFLFRTQVSGTVPLWIKRPSLISTVVYGCTSNRDSETRLERPKAAALTLSKLEQDGYELVGYAYSSPKPGAKPLYHYWNSEIRDRLFSVDPQEVGVVDKREIGHGNYRLEGIECYLPEHFGTVRVKPAADSHQWSKDISRFFCSQRPPSRRLICAPVAGMEDIPTFICEVHTAMTTPGRWELRPSLELRSALPCRLYCRVVARSSSNHDRAPVDFALASGEARGIFECDFDGEVTLQVAFPLAGEKPNALLPQCIWSDASLVYSRRGDAASSVTYTWTPPGETRRATLHLRLEYAKTQGHKRVTIYCPYHILNSCLLPVDLTTKIPSQGAVFRPNDPGYSGPVLYGPFNFNPAAAAEEDTLVVINSRQSTSFSIGNVLAEASEVQLSLPMDSPWSASADFRSQCTLVTSWKWSSSEHLARDVTIHAIVYFVNHTSDTLHVGLGAPQEVGCFQPPPSVIEVAAGQSVPLNCVLTCQLWRVRLESTLWSASFSAHRSQETVILKLMDSASGELRLLEVDCRKKEKYFEVHVYRATNPLPWRVENLCVRTAIRFSQNGCRNEYVLIPGEQMGYAWDRPDPDAKREFKIELDQQPGRSIIFTERDVGVATLSYNPGATAGSTATTTSPALEIHVCTFTHGGSTILIITEDIGKARAQYGLQPRVDENEDHLILDVVLDMKHGLGLSLIESYAQPEKHNCAFELLWLSLSGIHVVYSHTTQAQKLSASIQSFQLDDQRYQAANPVVVARSLEGEEGKDKPALWFAFVKRFAQLGFDSGVPYIDCVSFLLQPLSLKIDWSLLEALVGFSGGLRREFARIGDIVFRDARPAPQRKLRFETMLLQPIKLYLTFSLDGVGNDYVGKVLQSLGLLLVNVNHAPFALNALQLEGLYATPDEVVQTFALSYKKNILSSLAKFGLFAIGSLDVFGDPIHTLETLSTGVKDFFYEPAKGLMMGPEAFASGLQKGAKSLASGVFGGGTSAASKMVGAVSKGIGALSLDTEYQKNRDAAMKEASKSFGRGMLTGVTLLADGLIDGITGVIVQPVKGAEQEGAKGLLKGVVKGVIGFAAKPITGTLDLVSASLAGLNSLQDQAATGDRRTRPPRFIDPSTNVARVYSLRKASGALLMQTECKRAYMNDLYLDHEERLGDKGNRMVVCLLKRVLILEFSSVSGEYSVLQELDSAGITGRIPRETGVEIRLQNSGNFIIPLRDAKHIERVSRLLADYINIIFESPPPLKSELACVFPNSVRFLAEQAATAAKEQALREQRAQETVEALQEIWENERYFPFQGWTKNLRFRGAWTSMDMAIIFPTRDSVTPPAGWTWCGDWRVDMTGRACDKDSWQYAVDFGGPESSWAEGDKFGLVVRRRRWVRPRNAPALRLP
eukprot:m.346588 g.346588  ORF g.346588 m.346588 type:complete len:4204 (+) comp55837_c0_seq1:84-12695(+)